MVMLSKFYILFLLFLICECKKINTLQPFLAREISDEIKEPSGASFCNSTNSIWIICDKSSCNFIWETNLKGEVLNSWEFSDKNHDDVEAVACDDINKRLYMAEEGYMRITSFKLPIESDESSYYIDDDDEQYHLIELDTIEVDITDLRSKGDDLPGLEGLTWNPISENFIIANEKEPSLIISLSPEGELLHSIQIDYAEDLSGLAYDDKLDLLWVLSDKSERVYITDLFGETVYDYWDLPMENPEGIAINNLVDPPEMYIVTDPSSPHGKQYIAGFFAFTKPEIGTGRNFITKQESSVEEILCDGCDEVWELVSEMSSRFISSNNSSDKLKIIIPSSIIPILILFLFIMIIAIFLINRYRKQKKNHKINISEYDNECQIGMVDYDNEINNLNIASDMEYNIDINYDEDVSYPMNVGEWLKNKFVSLMQHKSG